MSFYLENKPIENQNLSPNTIPSLTSISSTPLGQGITFKAEFEDKGQIVKLLIAKDSSFTNCNFKDTSNCLIISDEIEPGIGQGEVTYILESEEDVKWYTQICNSLNQCNNDYKLSPPQDRTGPPFLLTLVVSDPPYEINQEIFFTTTFDDGGSDSKLLISEDNSFANCGYLDTSGCLAYSSNIPTGTGNGIASYTPISSGDVTWYAKICNSLEECDTTDGEIITLLAEQDINEVWRDQYTKKTEALCHNMMPSVVNIGVDKAECQIDGGISCTQISYPSLQSDDHSEGAVYADDSWIHGGSKRPECLHGAAKYFFDVNAYTNLESFIFHWEGYFENLQSGNPLEGRIYIYDILAGDYAGFPGNSITTLGETQYDLEINTNINNYISGPGEILFIAWDYQGVTNTVPQDYYYDYIWNDFVSLTLYDDGIELIGQYTVEFTGECIETEDCAHLNGGCDYWICNPSYNCEQTFNDSSTVCNPSAGECDQTEFCDGSLPTCPTDVFNSTLDLCRPSLGICDTEEFCDNINPLCPFDSVEPDTTVCLASSCDGLTFNFESTCQTGVCTEGGTQDCNDAVGCTDNSCDAVIGCDIVANDAICGDDNYCNGTETCNILLDCQPGEDVICSGNDLTQIANCNNNPDNNPLTWDYFVGFTSSCDEVNDECTTGFIDLTHGCNTTCGAECEIGVDCQPYQTCDTLSCTCVGGGQFQFTLNEGTNFISMPVISEPTPIPTLFSGLLDNLTSIHHYDPTLGWQSYYQNNAELRAFTELESKKGYFVVMSDCTPNCILDISGQINEDYINLESGWNMVGINGTDPVLIDDALNIANANITVYGIWELQNNQYEQYVDSQFYPGEGYWIYVEPPGGQFSQEQSFVTRFVIFIKSLFGSKELIPPTPPK